VTLSRRGFLLLSGAIPLLAACSGSSSPQVVPIAQPLPDSESLDYALLDTQDNVIGGATLSITRQGANLLLRQLYTQKDGSTDDHLVTVDAASMRPVSSERKIASADLHTSVRADYTSNSVSAIANDGKEHKQSQKLTVPGYDDGESFFLMRAVKFENSYSVHFADVAVDAKSANISRVLAQIRVAGKAQVKVQGKAFTAWEVLFSGAGRDATAWFEEAPGRRLLRYANPATTSIELANP
jgi:hypothetical protein